MINQLVKTVPLLVLGLGLFRGVGKARGFFDATRNMSVQSEVNMIAKTIKLETLDSGQQPPTPEQFPDFLRANLKMKQGITRDPAFDMWGSPYQLVQTASGVRVVSAGPDKVANTSDDVVAEVAL